jgi:hypothetical protein
MKEDYVVKNVSRYQNSSKNDGFYWMMEKKWFGNKEQINPTFQGQVFGT